MSAALLLLRNLLNSTGGPAETGYLLLIDGEGLENLPDQLPTPKGNYGLYRVATELGLRHLLWKAKGAPLIAVMPEDLALRVQKSPDILRRARHQRVFALSPTDVIEAVLGVRVVGLDTPYLQQLVLENIDKLSAALSKRTLPTVVDRRLLTEILVDMSVGEQVRTCSAAQLLATWVLDPPVWSQNVNRLVRDVLPSMHADEGRLLSWALGEPDKRLRELVVYGAVLTVDAPELPKNAWGPLWKVPTEHPRDMDRRVFRRAAAQLAEDVVAELGDKAGPLLHEADRVARETVIPTLLQTSRVLPLALADRCHSLAAQAAGGKAIRESDIAWLSSHRAARLFRANLAVIEAMGRLSRYLDETPSAATDILEQVTAYQRSGAFADLAMTELRRALSNSDAYHTEANKLLLAVRERRDRDNKRFAETLATGYEKELHREGVTPLHRLWKRTVAPVWQKDQEARLFLVVLDGCSYPVFLELLYSLAQDSSFPVGIRPDESGRVIGLPALSPLPTVTSHARGAIFLGELPNDPLVAETVFRDQEEAKTDKPRFQQNGSLGGRTRRLFLKGDLTDGGQSLLSALADEELSVVAVVFNAVDDQIGSANTGATFRVLPEDIAAFKPSLRAALKAGRKVLLTADHGHSLFIDKTLRAGAGKAPRYTALELGEAAPEGFLEIDLQKLGGPPERRAFAYRMGAYLGAQQVGFHGGAGLEEMVVPLAWLEKGGLAADEPAWWYGRGALPERAAPAKPVEPPHVTPLPSDELKPKPKAQLSLFNPADKADTLGLSEEVLSKLTNDEKAVLVLLRDNGTARASELAKRLQRNPGRLNGMIALLRKKLHELGLTLFTSDQLPDGETMYRYTGKGMK